MLSGLLQTVRALRTFWRMTANLEAERMFMQDKWGPPANGEGWPTFDDQGKRLLERAFGPEDERDKAEMDKHTAEIVRLLDTPAVEPEYAELGGEA